MCAVIATATVTSSWHPTTTRTATDCTGTKSWGLLDTWDGGLIQTEVCRSKNRKAPPPLAESKWRDKYDQYVC